MIYLTGQLLLFLLITAFLGFIIGWLLRGAMLPSSMFEGKEFIYHTKTPDDPSNYFQKVGEYVPSASNHAEHIES